MMTMEITLFAATALALSASAQTTPTAPAITRTIVAATKLPSVVETPLYFKAVRVILQPGGKNSLSVANGILYQLSGSTEISLGGENKVLDAGEALFVAAGKTASLSTGSGAPSILLYFLLAPAAELGAPTATADSIGYEGWQREDC
jgi:quercetin dioxygenase-like cupin family protein